MSKKEYSTDFCIDLVAHDITKLYFCKLCPNMHDIDHLLNINQGLGMKWTACGVASRS